MLESGKNAVIFCNATTSGNSSHQLAWSLDSQQSLLPILTVNQSILQSGGGGGSLSELCAGRTGVFHLLLPSELGQDLELDREGAIFLLLRGALLLCDVPTSLSGLYTCFVNGSVGSSASVQISSGAEPLPTVAKALLIACTITLLPGVAVAVLFCCMWRSRSAKRASRPMAPCPHQPHPSQHLPINATNNQFFEESFCDQEFPREKLQLLKVLGTPS